MMYETLIKVLRSEARCWRKCSSEDTLRHEIILLTASALEDLADKLEEVEDEEHEPR